MTEPFNQRESQRESDQKASVQSVHIGLGDPALVADRHVERACTSIGHSSFKLQVIQVSTLDFCHSRLLPNLSFYNLLTL